MEAEVSKLVEMFGVTFEDVGYVAGLVYVLMELVKKKFPSLFVGGWKTEVLALLLSGGIAYWLYAPVWESVIALTVIAWILPMGVHATRKNGG